MNRNDTLYTLIGKDYVRLQLTKNPVIIKKLQDQIDWITRSVIKILEEQRRWK